MIAVSGLRIWALGFTSIAIGALAVMAFCLVLARGNRELRLALTLTCFSAICSLATHGPFALLVFWESTGLTWPYELRLPFAPLGEAVVGLLWLSVMILFDDARITVLRLAPTLALMAVSIASLLTWGETFPYLAGWLAVAINLTLAAHAFVRVAQGWGGDLVEKRRRLRRPFLLMLGLVLAIVVTIQGIDFAAHVGRAPDALMTPIYEALDVALAAMAVATGVFFLEPHAALLAEAPPRSSPPSDKDVDDAALAKLESLMTQGEIWRREGLSVGALASELGMPEHRLRVLINGRLSHRNFAAFINTKRIDVAKRQLADRAFAETPISKIAYDLGFASLGPFNRAFKEATGQTPTEWRRSHQPAAAE